MRYNKSQIYPAEIPTRIASRMGRMAGHWRTRVQMPMCGLPSLTASRAPACAVGQKRQVTLPGVAAPRRASGSRLRHLWSVWEVSESMYIVRGLQVNEQR